MRGRLLGVFVVAALTGGCLDRRADTIANDTTTAEGNALPPHGWDTARATTSPADSGGGLAVEGEGLRVFTPSGSARPIPFGTATADVMSLLVSTEGRGPIAQGVNEDCGASFARWESGLSVWFSKGQFAGWSIDDADAKVTTASGIGIGSTRAELESAYNAQVARSTLGIEFTAGDLAGILDSEKPDARIAHLWAGQTCNAR